MRTAIENLIEKALQRLARKQIAGAYTDGQNSALRIALVEFDRARRLDLQAIITEIDAIGTSMSFEGADPKTAYQLGKQVCRDIITDRSK